MIDSVASVRAHENVKATTIAAIEREMNWMRIPSLDNWGISISLPTVFEIRGHNQSGKERILSKRSTAYMCLNNNLGEKTNNQISLPIRYPDLNYIGRASYRIRCLTAGEGVLNLNRQAEERL